MNADVTKEDMMRERLNTVSVILKRAFGYGVMIALFAGGLTFFGYLFALIIGGETAARICEAIHEVILPAIVYVSNGMIMIGLIAMYCAGEKALTPGK